MPYNDEKDSTGSLVGYQCGNCGGDTFQLHVVHWEKNGEPKTALLICCGTESCREERCKELGVPPGALPVWDEFDITGQGHDAETLAMDPDNLPS